MKSKKFAFLAALALASLAVVSPARADTDIGMRMALAEGGLKVAFGLAKMVGLVPKALKTPAAKPADQAPATASNTPAAPSGNDLSMYQGDKDTLLALAIQKPTPGTGGKQPDAGPAPKGEQKGEGGTPSDPASKPTEPPTGERPAEVASK